MADTKLPALTALTAPALADLLYSVDVSDTTDDASGSSRYMSLQTLLQHLPHGLDEISIMTTATATIGRIHVCSGTTSDYTVTLPAVSGNTGKLLTIRISNSCTKLITIDGNGSETIDGAAQRIMWAGESATLLCDGSQWLKIAGKSKAMVSVSAPSGSTSVSSGGSGTKIGLDTSVSDNSGLMNDVGNGRIVVPRDGVYRVSTVGRYTNVGAAARYAAGMWRTRSAVQTQWITLGEQSSQAGGYPSIACSVLITMLAADICELYAYQESGVTQTAGGSGNTANSWMALEETNVW